MAAIGEIEKEIQKLSDTDKLLLIERLAHSLRGSENTDIENQLKEMAEDPEIQAELTAINEEFAIAENDGLAIQ